MIVRLRPDLDIMKDDMTLRNFTADLQSFLYCRILISRLGESLRFAWWGKDLDATDYDGGGKFFQKLLVSDSCHIGLISSVEAPMESAKSFEWKKLKDSNNQTISLSLFIAPPKIESDLSDLVFHFKRFPEDIPENIIKIIDSKISKESLIEEFNKLREGLSKPKYEGTSFGFKVKEKIEVNSFSIAQINQLVSLVELKSNEWVFPYYE